MSEHNYTLTPAEVLTLRALAEGIVELTPTEVAVKGLLMPEQTRRALARLQGMGLVNSWFPVTGRTGDHVYVLTDEGQIVYRAFDQFKGTPPVGSVVRVPPAFSSWFSRQPRSRVEVVAENQHVTSE